LHHGLQMQSAKQEQELEWIRQAQRGDRDAFGRLVERYQRRIFSLVYHLLRKREVVEDLAQEIFLKAYLAIGKFNFESSFATWVGRIAVNHCYDYLRRERSSKLKYFSEMSEEASQRIEESAQSDSGKGSDVEKQTWMKETVGALLERASPDDRMILVLKEMEEFSVEEIAQIMKLTETAVKVRLHRARKRMLEDYARWRKGR
jgi:RNA polymerase sigma-70 factor, ECF subfamily